MSPIFPAAKVGGALMKTLAKPVSSRIQSLARTDDFWRGKTVALGQALNILSRRITRVAENNKTRRAIPPLKEAAALDWGATFIGESFVFGVTTLIIISEYQRAAKKDREQDMLKRLQREDKEAQSLRDVAERERRLKRLEDHIEFLHSRVDHAIADRDKLSRTLAAQRDRQQAPRSATDPGLSISDTKAAFKGWGHNLQEHLANAYGTEPVVVRDPDQRAWLLGRQSRSTADFYTVWRGIRRMTYRKNFETPLYNQNKHLEFHCDTGWGCTIRSAQMLLLVALKRHHGLDSSGARLPSTDDLISRGQHQPSDGVTVDETKLLRLFEDRFDRPFSIHAFMSYSEPGQWFGPARVCDVVHHLTTTPSLCHLGLAVYVDHDGLLKPEDVRAASAGRRSSTPDLRRVTMEIVAVEGSPRRGGSAAGSPTSSASDTSVGRRKRSWSLGSRGHEWAVLSPSDATVMRSRTGEDVSSPSHFVMVGFLGESSTDECRDYEVDGMEVDSSACSDTWHDCPTSSMTSPSAEDADGMAEEWSRGVLLLFPVRLTDGDQIDADSARVVGEYLKLPWCIGVIGGQSTRAHYIVGVAERDTYAPPPGGWGGGRRHTLVDLLSIDPHFVQSAVVEAQGISFKNSVDPSRLQPNRLNPSLAVGFYVKDQTDLEELSAELDRMKDGFIQVCMPGTALSSFSATSSQTSTDRVIVL
ncbi:Cysteine protease atg4b [Perkinsus olseni]|uniref:Cysteine protease n=1 Tax=Perkinsus olseni TaxID=32597 RepID=A0A7J6MDF3_PEROL|nr:Cysteine protease atg4b [Perkinsus olseni]